MAIRSKIHTVLNWADSYLSENRDRISNKEQVHLRSILSDVQSALSDIQTDNDGQFIIYTGIQDTSKPDGYYEIDE